MKVHSCDLLGLWFYNLSLNSLNMELGSPMFSMSGVEAVPSTLQCLKFVGTIKHESRSKASVCLFVLMLNAYL